MHISSPFRPKQRGKVFVSLGEGDWELCSESDVKDRPIITCVHCEKPAVQLDHFWPYHSEQNLCAFHSAPTGWVKTRWGRKWHRVEKGRYICSSGSRYSGRVRSDVPEQETICRRCLAQEAMRRLIQGEGMMTEKLSERLKIWIRNQRQTGAARGWSYLMVELAQRMEALELESAEFIEDWRRVEVGELRSDPTEALGAIQEEP